MKIKDVFAADVTRDIAPVVYFHEKSPQKIHEEVSEYIITGGYPPSDPRHKRVESGIHEQFVKLLTALVRDLQKSNGADLPASWISGFYGSGKSIFAKLLGMALDGLILPDNRPLADALLARDDSPKSQEFRNAWQSLMEIIDPMAVVFDIGAVARDNEHIHGAIKREIQARLGYCPVSHHVADHELKLELDGKWDEFLKCAEDTLDKPWPELNKTQLAEDHFSEVLHVMSPGRYTDPMSWIDSRAGSQSTIGSSVAETTKSITEMLRYRAQGKTLFIIVDEVSQYIHQNDGRMLKLQSFVSDLGQKLKGKVWLLATGQQKLEDTDDVTVISKLKDRFPPRFRVHLAATNIRDVVHKRLLKKDPQKEGVLREYFHRHRPDLKLNGYSCEEITESDFIEVYPLLPGHVDLLMQITSNLRLKSSRFKGDEHAIRGLLQLLGELFRDQALGEQSLPDLITIDRIYEVQQSALDADIQNSMMRILSHPDVSDDETAVRAAKAVTMLELIQEQTPTTAKLISRCLYSRLGLGNQEPEIQKALDKLCSLGLVSYSEKLGYKVQSSAGQEWQRDRDSRSVIRGEISLIIAEKLKALMGTLDRPRFKGKAFPWAGWYTDTRQRIESKLQAPADQAVVTVDFRYATAEDERQDDYWIQHSVSDDLVNRLIWVVGNLGQLESTVRDLVRSRQMVNRYISHIQSLPPSKQRLFYEEQSRCEDLEKKVQDACARTFMDGNLYFRGRKLDKQSHGAAFAGLLHGAATSILPELFRMFVDFAVTPGELKQLLEPNLRGPSQKFMESGLGILGLDAGKYIPVCSGEVPARIMQFIRESDGCSGSLLFTYFGGPPCGYPPDVIKACLAGLLRAGKIRIRPDAGADITSVRDPGAEDMFQSDRPIKRADILLPADTGINGRDRIAICKFFSEWLKIELDRENDAIADAVFQQFPHQMKRLQAVERMYNQLPDQPDLPETLRKLRNALENGMRSRQVEETVLAVKKNLDVLRDGMQQLGVLNSELTQEVIDAVTHAAMVNQNLATQLKAADRLEDLAGDAEAIENQLNQERPWRDIIAIEANLAAILGRYRDVRLELMERQERKAQEVRDRIKQRRGFEKLTADQCHHVLRPITFKLFDTEPDAIHPTLEQLRDAVITRLAEAEEEANLRMDDILTDVRTFRLNLKGRELSTAEDVENLIKTLRERLLAQIKDNNRIRLI